MGKIVFLPDIKKAIRSDGELFGKIAKELGYSPTYMNDLIREDDPKLTQARVLVIIRTHLNLSQDTQILTEMQEPAKEKVA